MAELKEAKFTGTVELEDHGQDFLEWDLKDGVVVACRPFQGWVWNGTLVHNTVITPGAILRITMMRKGKKTTLKYPVAKVRAKARQGKEVK
ncbi:MAG: hypothetical protein Q7T57_06675 [Dehalococcoidales bacterium]|nr:hypothetical protein [Dehalococcoidales bacterium]